MSLSSLLEKNVPIKTAIIADGESSVDVTVTTQDSLIKVGNASMTRRGGKRGVPRTVSNSSSSSTRYDKSKTSLDSTLLGGAMNESWASMESSQGCFVGAEEETVDSREHYSNSQRKSRRGGKRSKEKHPSASSNSSPVTPTYYSAPTPLSKERNRSLAGQRRTKAVAMSTGSTKHAPNPFMDWI
ncbi:hypothetical protein ACA910_009742 [Epithemia clementina (nom. ined.)]